MKKDLEERTLSFALRALDVVDQLPRSVANNVIAFQLAKASTAVGAIYREARRAQSKKDFIHKIGLVAKEAAESEYWLVLLAKRAPSDNINELQNESNALTRIFVASGLTAARSLRRPPRS
jgi:four helix bundle protein